MMMMLQFLQVKIFRLLSHLSPLYDQPAYLRLTLWRDVILQLLLTFASLFSGTGLVSRLFSPL
jgi:hypothetical protein